MSHYVSVLLKAKKNSRETQIKDTGQSSMLGHFQQLYIKCQLCIVGCSTNYLTSFRSAFYFIVYSFSCYSNWIYHRQNSPLTAALFKYTCCIRCVQIAYTLGNYASAIKMYYLKLYSIGSFPSCENISA